MKSKIKYGNVDIPAEDFLPENCMIKLSVFVRGDLYDKLKEKSKKEKKTKEDIINELLKDHL